MAFFSLFSPGRPREGETVFLGASYCCYKDHRQFQRDTCTRNSLQNTLILSWEIASLLDEWRENGKD